MHYAAFLKFIIIMRFRNIASPDLDLLKALLALADEQHLTKAGQELGLTQPGMSHALRRLRDLFDEELFVRTHEGMTPTPYCLSLVPHVRQALAELDNVLGGEQKFTPSEAAMTLRIGMNDLLATLLLPSLMEKIARLAPGIDIRVLHTLSVGDYAIVPTDPFRDIDAGRSDIAIIQDLKTSTRFVREKLFSVDYVCVARKQNRMFRPPIDIETYNTLNHIMVSFGDVEFSRLDADLEARGLQRQIKVRVPLYTAAQSIAAQTDFVHTMPRILLPSAAEHYDFKVSELPVESPTRDYYFVWKSTRASDPALAWLRQLIRECFDNGERTTVASTRTRKKR